MRIFRRMSLIWLAAIAATLASSVPALAQQATDVSLNAPVRAFTFGDLQKKADIDIGFFNRADSQRIVHLELSDVTDPSGNPATGWDVGIWDTFFNYRISELVLQPTQADVTPSSAERPRMRIRPPDPLPDPGTYSFTLTVTDANNPNIQYDQAVFKVGIPQPTNTDTGEITVQATHAGLIGPANTAYSYEIQVKNTTSDQLSIDLSASVTDSSQNPLQGWDIGFTPTFGDKTRLANVAVDAGGNERVDVSVTPPTNTQPGDYFIPVSISAADGQYTGSELLGLRITGKGALTVSTTSGRLSMNATAGKETTNTLRFTNTGTGDLSNVALSADPPNADWKVDFQIDNIESLPANNQIDVNVNVTPPADAIPGDYQLTFRGRSADATSSAVIRVTVDQSTIWGWLGLVLVLLVVGALMGLFWRLGRR